MKTILATVLLIVSGFVAVPSYAQTRTQVRVGVQIGHNRHYDRGYDRRYGRRIYRPYNYHSYNRTRFEVEIVRINGVWYREVYRVEYMHGFPMYRDLVRRERIFR